MCHSTHLTLLMICCTLEVLQGFWNVSMEAETAYGVQGIVDAVQEKLAAAESRVAELTNQLNQLQMEKVPHPPPPLPSCQHQCSRAIPDLCMHMQGEGTFCTVDYQKVLR